MHKADGVRASKSDPNFGIIVEENFDLYRDTYGADWADRLRRLDPSALQREAETLFEQVAADYADVPHNDKLRSPGPLGDLARFYLRDLALGKPAPEITGTDLDGQPFRLSDLRGKVVVLDFGSHFYCGLCRYAYPRLRALTKRYQNRPFAVVSINAEPEKDVSDLKTAWLAEGNTWRCLFDNSWEGPIHKSWNIVSFPTFYVLDAQGTIRFKNTGMADVDATLDELETTVAKLMENNAQK